MILIAGWDMTVSQFLLFKSFNLHKGMLWVDPITTHKPGLTNDYVCAKMIHV